MKASLIGVLVVVGGSFAGCARDDVVFYEVTEARVEECAIRSNGEFCVEPDQFDPPRTTVWTVEFNVDKASLLVVDEEVYVLDGGEDGEDPKKTEQTATRSNAVTSGAGPCTSTREETLRFVADGATLTGSLDVKSVLTGPEACGSTPVGERTSDTLAGSAITADGFPVGP